MVARGALVATAIGIAVVPRTAAAEPDWIVDDRPAEVGAVPAAAGLVAEGEALGRANKYELALGKFLAAAGTHPAATHDCYVALAYLRIGRLTLARLWIDAAARRGDDRPAWCTGAITDELAGALTTRGFVELPVRVRPRDAEVWVGDAHFRGDRSVWLPPGDVEVRAELAGHRAEARTVSVAAGSTVALELAAAPVAEPRPERPSRRPHRRTAAWVATLGGAAFAITGGVFHALALDTKGDANALAPTDPEFTRLDQRFGRERALAIGGYALGAVGLGLGIYFFTRSPGAEPGGLAVDLRGDGAVVSWSFAR